MSRNRKIFVTKTFLPPIEEYEKYLETIWESGQLTNQGLLLKEFEGKIAEYLGVKNNNFHFITNGTLALQLSLRALDIEGEVITTPFSYVATTSAILWEKCEPIYVDIDPETLCIDPNKIEQAITEKTKAILAVHVFGNPCDIDAIEKIAQKHKIKVIYDGAHAFGAEYKSQPLLTYGDISICSFHSTKLFHTIEGGCIILNSDSINKNVDLLKRFGHYEDKHYSLGINAKASEFQAAMGLCNFKYINEIIEKRGKIIDVYDRLLKDYFMRPKLRIGAKYNNSYYPIIFKNEESLQAALKKLSDENIFPRRYFYPSLNTLPYLKGKKQSCPISEDISRRTLCLPLYADMKKEDVHKISKLLVSDDK